MLFGRPLVFADHCSPEITILSDSPPSQNSVGKEEARLGGRGSRRGWREPIWERQPRAHLVHNLGEGILQFPVHCGQLLVVSMGLKDGDEVFVDFVHRFIQTTLGNRKSEVRRPETFCATLNPRLPPPHHRPLP